eukprot:7222523-Pyramimonas_sp.AAC.1
MESAWARCECPAADSANLHPRMHGEGIAWGARPLRSRRNSKVVRPSGCKASQKSRQPGGLSGHRTQGCFPAATCTQGCFPAATCTPPWHAEWAA